MYGLAVAWREEPVVEQRAGGWFESDQLHHTVARNRCPPRNDLGLTRAVRVRPAPPRGRAFLRIISIRCLPGAHSQIRPKQFDGCGRRVLPARPVSLWAKYGYLKHIDRFQDGDALDAWIADGRRDAALVWIELDRSRLGGDAAWRPDVGLDPGFERLRPFRFSVDHLLFRFPIAIGREAVTLANVSSVGER